MFLSRLAFEMIVDTSCSLVSDKAEAVLPGGHGDTRRAINMGVPIVIDLSASWLLASFFCGSSKAFWILFELQTCTQSTPDLQLVEREIPGDRQRFSILNPERVIENKHGKSAVKLPDSSCVAVFSSALLKVELYCP